MNEILRPGSGILFMKVGTHAQEPIEEIIARKTKEIEDAGYALWGYGGNTCHPQTMVQPFAEEFEKHGRTIYLCMEKMESKHFAEPLRADEFSSDGKTWRPIPQAIHVLGSRYALVIKSLLPQEFELPLEKTVVAVGNSQGRRGDKYIQGRVDKACLALSDGPKLEENPEPASRKISLVAELQEPYAVFVRNRI